MALGPSSSHIFSMKSPSSSSTLISSKLKTIVQTFILSHIYRIARALTKAKSLVIEVLKDIQLVHFMQITIKKNKNKNKLFLGSFRMHYNWCTSKSSNDHHHNLYYDSTWNNFITNEYEEDLEESELSGYLHWLEQKAHEDLKGHANDIDRLADLFIANCHEKFKLEKQESYRRFQDMLARSV